MAQVNYQDRVWHNVRRAWLKRLAMACRMLRENGAYITRDKDMAYQVCYNVEGTRVEEHNNGICKVEYVDAVPQTSAEICKNFKLSL